MKKIIVLLLSIFVTTFNQDYIFISKEINIFKNVELKKKEEKKKTVKKKKSTNSVPVLATYKGNITAYGPDCVGCIGRTASGYKVTGGNIYYHDKTYGKIRIVAADKSLPFGTIVRIKDLSVFQNPVLAIVLDRGSAIGFNKNVYFDLLYNSEAETNSFGKRKATFEILRKGY